VKRMLKTISRTCLFMMIVDILNEKGRYDLKSYIL